MTNQVILQEAKKGYVWVKCANVKCNCDFEARIADRNRGWGKFCSKSCKATKQEAATGAHKSRKIRLNNYRRFNDDYSVNAYHVEHGGWDAHKEIF